MSEDCPTCGARPRHQRLVERECAWCDEPFDVLSEASRKRFCGRGCQLWALRANKSEESFD